MKISYIKQEQFSPIICHWTAHQDASRFPLTTPTTVLTLSHLSSKAVPFEEVNHNNMVVNIARITFPEEMTLQKHQTYPTI